jgi:hypothetical protein
MNDMTHNHIDTLVGRMKMLAGIHEDLDRTLPDWSKIEGEMRLGAVIEIVWHSDFGDIADRGVVFTLPGELHDDWDLTGIVYVPEPWGEGADPVWIALADLLAMEFVTKVKVVG